MPIQRQSRSKDSKDKLHMPETEVSINKHDLVDGFSNQSLEHSGLRMPMNTKQGKKRCRELSQDYLQIFS